MYVFQSCIEYPLVLPSSHLELFCFHLLGLFILFLFSQILYVNAESTIYIVKCGLLALSELQLFLAVGLHLGPTVY
jgi:hypothetical protein